MNQSCCHFKKNLIGTGRYILDGWDFWYEGLDIVITKKDHRIFKFKKIPAINYNIYCLTSKSVEKSKFKY